MKEKRSLGTLLTCGLVLVGLGASISWASAPRYDFEIFSTNGPYYNDPGLDLYVLVSEVTGQVRFEFHNDSTIPSSIEGVYFDDGSLLGIASIENGVGTSFSQGSSPPNLPGGEELVPPFETTQGFLAESDPAPPSNGVGPGEWMAITFDLINGADLNAVCSELDSGAELRIGAHIIGMPEDSSESAVVPEPATLGLLLLGGLVLLRRKL